MITDGTEIINSSESSPKPCPKNSPLKASYSLWNTCDFYIFTYPPFIYLTDLAALQYKLKDGGGLCN